MIRRLPLLALLFAGACASAQRPAAPAAHPSAARLGSELKLRLPASTGGEVTLESFRGRPLVVVFFATWAERADALLPQLQRLAAESRLEVVAVALDEDPRFVAPFVRRHALRFPVLLDPGGETSERELPLRVLPTVAVLDANGRVSQLHEQLRKGVLKRIAARAKELEGSAGTGALRGPEAASPETAR